VHLLILFAFHVQVQNHIGGIHACGMALLSETATGALLAMNVPDTHLPLCKSFKIDFKRLAKGFCYLNQYYSADLKSSSVCSNACTAV
jgi:Domain of unknown function (DUF4442)